MFASVSWLQPRQMLIQIQGEGAQTMLPMRLVSGPHDKVGRGMYALTQQPQSSSACEADGS